MLVYNESLENLPIASVQATRRIGLIQEAIIDPRDLSIPALYVQPGRTQAANLVLFTSDIRSFTAQGIIIDHDEQLMETEGLVRLQEVIDLKFQLIGKKVETEDGQGLGSVERFAFDNVGWKIMKLLVKPKATRSISSSGLIVARQQIVKVTDSRVIVKSTAIKEKPKAGWKRWLMGDAKPALNTDSTTLD